MITQLHRIMLAHQVQSQICQPVFAIAIRFGFGVQHSRIWLRNRGGSTCPFSSTYSLIYCNTRNNICASLYLGILLKVLDAQLVFVPYCTLPPHHFADHCRAKILVFCPWFCLSIFCMLQPVFSELGVQILRSGIGEPWRYNRAVTFAGFFLLLSDESLYTKHQRDKYRMKLPVLRCCYVCNHYLSKPSLIKSFHL